MQTYIIYISVIFIAVMLAYVADKRNEKNYILLCALVLSLVAGLRGVSVGIDTAQYTKYFGLIAQDRLELVYGLEDSFVYICKILLSIWNNPSFLFLLFACVTNFLIMSRIWDFRKSVSLSWAIAVYCGMFYFMTFNIMRQFLAAAIVFYATRYVYRGQYFRFLFGVGIGFLFHKSALLGVVFLACEVFVWEHLGQRQKKFLLCAAMIAPVAAIIVGGAVIDKYLRYFQNIQLDFGIMLPIKLVFFAFIVFIGQLGESVEEHHYEGVSGEYTLKTVKIYYIIGLIMTALGYIFPFVERIGIYFYVFEVIFMGMVARSAKNQAILKPCLTMIYGYVLISSIFGNAQGQANYLFIWQG